MRSRKENKGFQDKLTLLPGAYLSTLLRHNSEPAKKKSDLVKRKKKKSSQGWWQAHGQAVARGFITRWCPNRSSTAFRHHTNSLAEEFPLQISLNAALLSKRVTWKQHLLKQHICLLHVFRASPANLTGKSKYLLQAALQNQDTSEKWNRYILGLHSQLLPKFSFQGHLCHVIVFCPSVSPAQPLWQW